MEIPRQQRENAERLQLQIENQNPLDSNALKQLSDYLKGYIGRLPNCLEFRRLITSLISRRERFDTQEVKLVAYLARRIYYKRIVVSALNDNQELLSTIEECAQNRCIYSQSLLNLVQLRNLRESSQLLESKRLRLYFNDPGGVRTFDLSRAEPISDSVDNPLDGPFTLLQKTFIRRMYQVDVNSIYDDIYVNQGYDDARVPEQNES